MALTTGHGNIVGQVIASHTHMKIEKVAFTRSMVVGREIMEAVARTLKT